MEAPSTAAGEGVSLPTGTVTFLFTDIEASTLLIQELGEGYTDLLETHTRLITDAVQASGGVKVATEGDGIFAVFPSALDAVNATVRAQRELSSWDWPEGVTVGVRMGLHTGEGVLGGDNYVGIDVHRAARIAGAGHGGQVLLSAPTADLATQGLPEGASLADIGRHVLRGFRDAERLYQLRIDGLPSEFPPLRSLDTVSTNLPVQLTSFVGRESEVREAITLLDGTRLLTLTGSGGTGKTRLAIEVAGHVAHDFLDGTYFVTLSAITDPEVVPSAVLETLGVIAAGLGATAASPRDQLLGHLEDREYLLILDNFEHLLEAAPLVADILHVSGRTKIIATSRAPLRVAGEQEMPVPPLGLPVLSVATGLSEIGDTEAVALFVDRATAVRPGFEVTDANAAGIAELTVKLDGLPLGIELAASWVKVLPPQAILERLGEKLLTDTGSRDVSDRHHSLRAAIAWSYDLLDEPTRRVFERFSAFAGGCNLQQAEEVCAADGLDVLAALAELVDHSLLRHSENGVEPRFFMLQTIREFATDCLRNQEDRVSLGGVHARAYLSLAERARDELMTAQRGRWLDRLSQDHDNFRAALAWVMDRGDTEMALRFIGPLWRFWQMRGHLYAGRKLAEEALAMEGGSQQARADAVEAAGGIAYWQGDLPAARAHYEQSLSLWEQVGNPAQVAYARYNLAFPIGMEGDWRAARQMMQESLDEFRELEHEGGVADATWGLGAMLVYDAGHEEALGCFAESIEAYERVGDSFGLTWGLYEYGNSLMRLQRYAEAREPLERGLTMVTEAGDLSAQTMFLNCLSALDHADGRDERAAVLFGAVDHLLQLSGAGLVNIEFNITEPLTPETRQRLIEAFRGNYQKGLAMTADEAVAYALGEAKEQS